MSAEFAIILLSAVFEDDDLVIFAVLKDLGCYDCSVNIRSADHGSVILTEKDHLIKRYLLAFFGVDLFKA